MKIEQGYRASSSLSGSITQAAAMPGKRTLVDSLPAQCKGSSIRSADVASRASSGPPAQLRAAGDRLALLFGPVQRKGEAPTGETVTPASGGGQPLPAPVRAKMERAMDADFSAVRIHEGPQAAQLGRLHIPRARISISRRASINQTVNKARS
jgi:hypothetical protein